MITMGLLRLLLIVVVVAVSTIALFGAPKHAHYGDWYELARARALCLARPTRRVSYDTTLHPMWDSTKPTFYVQKCRRPDDAKSTNPATYEVFHQAVMLNLSSEDVVPTLKGFASLVGIDVTDRRLALVYVDEFHELFDPCGIFSVVKRQYTRGLTQAFQLGDGSGWFRYRQRGQLGGTPTVSLHMYVGDGSVRSTPLDASKWIELAELFRSRSGFGLAIGVERMEFVSAMTQSGP